MLIFINRYTIDLETDKIGHGAHGCVYKATDTYTNETVAIKVMRIDIISNLTNHEISLLSQITHPNIVKYITHFSCTVNELESVCLITPFYQRFSL